MWPTEHFDLTPFCEIGAPLITPHSLLAIMSLAMFRVAALFASLAVSTVAVSNPSSYAQPYVRGAFMVEFEGSDSATFSANCVGNVVIALGALANTLSRMHSTKILRVAASLPSRVSI